ncbi:hypothetical protein BMAJHU_C0402 [Burkholderia mallei JHU]|nr:hypothetical protein BMAFMH_C0384 [Burkholderia mallei FMH]EDK60363.1 hypothetical protein BMAJHU_C0402 [Burkholderia mallei JHU]
MRAFRPVPHAPLPPCRSSGCRTSGIAKRRAPHDHSVFEAICASV